jgi:phosphatidylethanolamine/phosphatidyl-N-methylethanolamine N-methyltransferase
MTPDGVPPSPQRRAASTVHLFGREWLRAPFAVGAVAPSGRALARAITTGLSDDSGPVLELGPGTGVFTTALLARGIPASRIAAVEASGGFATALARRLPGVTVIAGDAARVRHLSPFAPGEVGTVICGLPLLSMPQAKVLRIVAGSFAALRPTGEFRLFTYGATCPVPGRILERLGLAARRSAIIPFNMPPASVYVLRRAGGNL